MQRALIGLALLLCAGCGADDRPTAAPAAALPPAKATTLAKRPARLTVDTAESWPTVDVPIPDGCVLPLPLPRPVSSLAFVVARGRAELHSVRAVRAAGEHRFVIKLDVTQRFIPGRRLALLRAGARIATVQVVARAGDYVWIDVLQAADAKNAVTVLAGDRLGPANR